MHGVIANELLLRQVAGGDRDAFRTLYANTSRMVYSVCLSLLKDRGRAEDIVQDTYARVWDKAGGFDPEKGSASTWIVVMARRLALNELRRHKHEGPSLDDDESNFADTLAADIPFADPIGKGRLVPCLEKLAELQRKAILMCYVHGYTNEEVSRRLGRPPGTVKSWLSRGLADLRKCME